MDQVSGGTVDSFIGCGVGDVLNLPAGGIVVKEERIVGIFPGVPLVEV